jgi:hypothetical protein
MAAAPLPLPVAAPRPGWIVAPGYDVCMFIGSLLVPLMLWVAFAFGWMTGVAVYATFQLAFNMPHNFQTWTMSILDADDRAKHGRRYAAAVVVIALVLGVPMIASPTIVWPWVRDALIYWGYYHLVRQHYGLLRLYERRMAVAGSPGTDRESDLYKRFLDVVSYAPLILRFGHPEQLTLNVRDRHFEIHHPPLPAPVATLVWAIYLGTIAAAVVHHVVAALRGRKWLLPRALLLTSVTFAFGLAGLAIADFIVAVAVVTAYHNLQYLGLVYFMNGTRAELADREQAPLGNNRPIDWIRTGRFPLYVLVTFGYGLFLLAPVALLQGKVWAQLPISVAVALHYYVDSRVWKFNAYPAHARFLRLRA